MDATDLIVCGDCNLDCCITTNLEFTFASLIANGCVAHHPIEERPGGTGLLFALQAKRRGLNPRLIGCIGTDPAGRVLLDYCNSHDLSTACLVRSDTAPTGKAIIVRDSNDIRLLIDNGTVGIPNANRGLTVDHVHAFVNQGLFPTGKLLYVSGYCLLPVNHSRGRAITLATNIAHQAGLKIVVDVVPHQIYNYYKYEELRTAIPKIDVLISEVSTMRRLLKIGTRQEEVSQKMAEETRQLLANEFEYLILRWGPSGVDHELISRRNHSTVILHHGGDHRQTLDKRGFGDRIALDALQSQLRLLG